MQIQRKQSPVYATLEARAHIISSIRRFFCEQGYLEVETPIRIPAPAPEANIEAFESEGWFLHTSPELCMKRLVAAGFPKIFQICRCFRKNERGTKHLSEFTLLEWYHTDYSYIDIMGQCEQLLNFILKHTSGVDFLTYRESKIDFSLPWDRMSVEDAFETFASLSLTEALKKNAFDECLAFEIEPYLGKYKPLFLYDYPVELGALAQTSESNPKIAERFELYIAGLELCNAFTELTDAVEQRKRFEKELNLRQKKHFKTDPMPEAFLEALQFLPPVSGNALGIDRLVMLLTNSACIDDVSAFIPEEL